MFPQCLAGLLDVVRVNGGDGNSGTLWISFGLSSQAVHAMACSWTDWQANCLDLFVLVADLHYAKNPLMNRTTAATDNCIVVLAYSKPSALA